nr:hypothetical protein [uncultured Acetobacterium sp.]
MSSDKRLLRESQMARDRKAPKICLRKACEESFYTLENIYAEKLIENGFTKEVAQELSAIILAMIEGAITISVTQKNYTDLILVSKQIGILLNHYLSEK